MAARTLAAAALGLVVTVACAPQSSLESVAHMATEPADSERPLPMTVPSGDVDVAALEQDVPRILEHFATKADLERVNGNLRTEIQTSRTAIQETRGDILQAMNTQTWVLIGTMFAGLSALGIGLYLKR